MYFSALPFELVCSSVPAAPAAEALEPGCCEAPCAPRRPPRPQPPPLPERWLLLLPPLLGPDWAFYEAPQRCVSCRDACTRSYSDARWGDSPRVMFPCVRVLSIWNRVAEWETTTPPWRGNAPANWYVWVAQVLEAVLLFKISEYWLDGLLNSHFMNFIKYLLFSCDL